MSDGGFPREKPSCVGFCAGDNGPEQQDCQAEMPSGS